MNRALEIIVNDARTTVAALKPLAQGLAWGVRFPVGMTSGVRVFNAYCEKDPGMAIFTSRDAFQAIGFTLGMGGCLIGGFLAEQRGLGAEVVTALAVTNAADYLYGVYRRAYAAKETEKSVV